MGILRYSPILPLGRILVPCLDFVFDGLVASSGVAQSSCSLKPLIPGALLIGSWLTVLNKMSAEALFPWVNRYQAYGVIGGVLVFTLWVWMVGVILYFGQCWSVVNWLRSFCGASENRT